MIDVFTVEGEVRSNEYIHAQKTSKANQLWIKPGAQDLLTYWELLRLIKFDHHGYFRHLSRNDQVQISTSRKFYCVMV